MRAMRLCNKDAILLAMYIGAELENVQYIKPQNDSTKNKE
jgi:hypothetical protein